jgi:hypothetical protein
MRARSAILVALWAGCLQKVEMPTVDLSVPTAPDMAEPTDAASDFAIDPCAGVTCTALDSCHVAGVCDPASGLCSHPNAPDDAGCDDHNACTQIDTCNGGTCMGASPISCTALDPLDPCHVGTCNTSSGACEHPNAPDTTSCQSGAGTCNGGICHCTSRAGTASLGYTDPIAIPGSALVKLVRDAASTPAVLVLKGVATQSFQASALRIGFPLRPSSMALDAMQAGDVTPGFSMATLTPPSPNPSFASLDASDVLTVSVDGSGTAGDTSIAPGAEIFLVRLVPVATDACSGTALTAGTYTVSIRTGGSNVASQAAVGTLTVF